MSLIREHLRDNSGDGYLWFIMIMFVFLIMMGAIYNVIDTSIGMKNVRTEIDAAAEDVYADIRQTSYEALTAGATNNTFTSYSDAEIAELLADKLNADISYQGIEPVITLIDSNGEWHYTITNLSYTYIDRTKNQSSTYVTYEVGDVNRDGNIDNDDLEIAKLILEGEVPDGIYRLDADINKDGFVTQSDIDLLESLIKYYAQYNKEAHYDTSVALLVLTFKIEVPISFGTFDFGSDTDTYSYVTSLTVKPA